MSLLQNDGIFRSLCRGRAVESFLTAKAFVPFAVCMKKEWFSSGVREGARINPGNTRPPSLCVIFSSSPLTKPFISFYIRFICVRRSSSSCVQLRCMQQRSPFFGGHPKRCTGNSIGPLYSFTFPPAPKQISRSCCKIREKWIESLDGRGRKGEPICFCFVILSKSIRPVALVYFCFCLHSEFLMEHEDFPRQLCNRICEKAFRIYGDLSRFLFSNRVPSPNWRWRGGPRPGNETEGSQETILLSSSSGSNFSQLGTLRSWICQQQERGKNENSDGDDSSLSSLESLVSILSEVKLKKNMETNMQPLGEVCLFHLSASLPSWVPDGLTGVRAQLLAGSTRERSLTAERLARTLVSLDFLAPASRSVSDRVWWVFYSIAVPSICRLQESDEHWRLRPNRTAATTTTTAATAPTPLE